MAAKHTSCKRSAIYTIDLLSIDGDGSFPCPKCGVIISPDDETDEIYQIVDTKVEGDRLSELTLKCNRCGSIIRLVGFLIEVLE
ncbi:MAG: hypothetical protein QXR17_02075 [Candidatus Bathyarchaeia archaeon]